METTNPGQITTLSQSDIPTGSPVGYQIIKAATNAVVLARTTSGVSEAPVGSGNFVLNFTAPAEPELYLVVIDWNAGAINAATSEIIQLRVVSQDTAASTNLASIADYARMHLGSETWTLLREDAIYGDAMINQLIGVVKARIFTTPPADEATLPVVVLNYLGLLVALQLTVPAGQAWASKAYSFSKGNEPVETVVYTNRAELWLEHADSLQKKLQAAQDAALPLITDPAILAGIGPAIDEEIIGARVTDDPRRFPNEHEFPYAPSGYFGRYR